jgi:DNA topoisomerase-1
LFDAAQAANALSDPKDDAQSAGLRHVCDSQPGIKRKKRGKGFAYFGQDGSMVRTPALMERIRSLAIPPAWTDVWICPHANGHLQATGRDARGRKQYRYHPLFREVREDAKYEHIVGFARTLPVIRETVARDMAMRGLPRQKILATVVHLLETTSIRIGNDDYARKNDSYGLTTLQNCHVAVNGAEVRFRFMGKSGKQWSLRVKDRRIAKIVKSCQDLPGQDLLQYIGENGSLQNVTSTDVNAYLREITGQDITAKDFRTWAGTVMAAVALRDMADFETAVEGKKNVKDATARVAARLGNTPAICRKCYIHPRVFESYLGGCFILPMSKPTGGRSPHRGEGLSPEEASVLSALQSELSE